MRPFPARFALPALAALGLVSCSYKQDSFRDDYATAICTLYNDCEVLSTVGGWETMDACLAEMKAKVDPELGRCPDYDKKIALDCVNGVNQMTCESLADDAFPPACAQTCPEAAHSIENRHGIPEDTGQ